MITRDRIAALLFLALCIAYGVQAQTTGKRPLTIAGHAGQDQRDQKGGDEAKSVGHGSVSRDLWRT